MKKLLTAVIAVYSVHSNGRGTFLCVVQMNIVEQKESVLNSCSSTSDETNVNFASNIKIIKMN